MADTVTYPHGASAHYVRCHDKQQGIVLSVFGVPVSAPGLQSMVGHLDDLTVEGFSEEGVRLPPHRACILQL